MARQEGTYSERVGARISPELKTHLRQLAEDTRFDSEADLVREALWVYVERCGSLPPPSPTPPTIEQVIMADVSPPATPDDVHELRHDLHTTQDKMEWLLSVMLIMVGLIGSKVLNAVRTEQIKPAELVDEAIQESVYNHDILWRKLRAARRIVRQREEEDAKG